MRSTRAWGLGTKIMGLILVTIVALSTWSVFQVRDNLRQYLTIQLEKQGLAIAQDAAGRSLNLIYTNNIYTLYRVIQNTTTTNDDVRYMLVLDGQGEVIAHTFPKGLPVGLRLLNNKIDLKGRSIKIINTQDGVIKDIAVPIQEGKSGLNGVVRVGMMQKYIDESVKKTTINLLTKALIVLVLGMASAYLITRVLTYPILELAQATREIASGNYSPRGYSTSGTSEVYQLAHSFNKMIQRLKESKEQTDFLEEKRKQLLAKVFDVQEEERKRIARELHDETGQSLAAIMFELRLIDDQTTPEEICKRTENIRKIINGTLDSLKNLIWELRPSSLDDLGLEDAIRKHIIGHLKSIGVHADLQVHNIQDITLNPEVVTTVFRIVQEAVTNAIKHAGAKNISIVLEASGQEFLAIIEDDGVGFEVEKTLHGALGEKRFGLFGMEERANLVQGELFIESEPQSGTTIYLKVPLKGDIYIEENQSIVS